METVPAITRAMHTDCGRLPHDDGLILRHRPISAQCAPCSCLARPPPGCQGKLGNNCEEMAQLLIQSRLCPNISKCHHNPSSDNVNRSSLNLNERATGFYCPHITYIPMIGNFKNIKIERLLILVLSKYLLAIVNFSLLKLIQECHPSIWKPLRSALI